MSRSQIDFVCGRKVDPEKARALRRISEYGKNTYYFCTYSCKESFDRKPERFAMKVARAG